MKILITMQLPYVPALGGANKCNRMLAEALVKANHILQVIVPATNEVNAVTLEQFHNQLKTQGVSVQSQAGVDRFHLKGVEVHALHEPAKVRSHLIDQIKAFDPDWVLVSGEEWSQGLLEAALKAIPSRVIYLAHTVLFLPFGPQAFFPSQERTKLFKRATGIIACSRFVHDYIQTWGHLDSMAFHFPAFGSGPFSNFGCFDSGFVTLINPSVGKGLTIFLGLARAFPDIPFACVPTWGTTQDDRAELARLPNITVLDPHENIDRLFSQTRVLALPSLWPEGFPLTSVEAMLRGIPVLASNAGGLPEAKLGTDFVLPVKPIETFTDELDDRSLPIPIIPKQTDEEIQLWCNTLQSLLSDKALYDRQSTLAREKALDFVSRLSVHPLENFLMDLGLQPAKPSSQFELASRSPILSTVKERSNGFSMELAQLTPEQQSLLFQWLQTSKLDGPGATDDDLADLLKNIDALSEEEAQAILEKEVQDDLGQ